MITATAHCEVDGTVHATHLPRWIGTDDVPPGETGVGTASSSPNKVMVASPSACDVKLLLGARSTPRRSLGHWCVRDGATESSACEAITSRRASGG